MNDENNYVIEGTIREIEISKDKNEVKIRLCGLEGYLLKQNENRFNLVCSENLKSGYTIVAFDEKEKFRVCSSLLDSTYLGHRVRLVIDKIVDEHGINLNSADKLDITSLILLAD
ncbi:MAG: hypothetical protein IJP62_13365 [Treponema sp.]|nr:hypothetical protein [Treponema sp.]